MFSIMADVPNKEATKRMVPVVLHVDNRVLVTQDTSFPSIHPPSHLTTPPLLAPVQIINDSPCPLRLEVVFTCGSALCRSGRCCDTQKS